ncbi:hypothetical protein [Petrocella sp. FN5]|nr:hypothetical protein [Petrocella sp. FN5]MDF1618195.1 hypothetical protein [Petrocella sp. FN5]
MEVKQDDSKKKPRTLPTQVGEIATGLSTIIQKMDEAKEKALKND